MAKEIHTEISINASPAKVWAILTDFDNALHFPIFMNKRGVDKMIKNNDGQCLIEIIA